MKNWIFLSPTYFDRVVFYNKNTDERFAQILELKRRSYRCFANAQQRLFYITRAIKDYSLVAFVIV